MERKRARLAPRPSFCLLSLLRDQNTWLMPREIPFGSWPAEIVNGVPELNVLLPQFDTALSFLTVVYCARKNVRFEKLYCHAKTFELQSSGVPPTFNWPSLACAYW